MFILVAGGCKRCFSLYRSYPSSIDAPYVWVTSKIFGSPSVPDYAHGYFSRKF